MTNIVEYRNELCKEFIKNEEDWLLRSENIASLKKARKEKERKEELHKKNVEFLLSLAVAFIMIATFFNIDTKLAAIIALPIGVLVSIIDWFEERKRGL